MEMQTMRDPKRNKKVHDINYIEELPESVRAIRRRVRIQAFTMLASVALVLVLVFAMTAAWYTNVAKTSDLTFQTEVWGFDESKITLPEASDVILAAPGTEGIIPLTIDNSDSENGVRISVMISKLLMEDEELKKRIYFYADTPMWKSFTNNEEQTEKTGEMMNRVYIGASESDSYTYTIFPGQKLAMSETYYNDVPLKWEWVFDVTGYYFLGTVDEDKMAGEAGAVTADEYIRPIIYDYSKAVFDAEVTIPDPNTEEGAEEVKEIRNKNYGQMVRIGEKTREKFLEEISKTDGYPGEIDVKNPVVLLADTTDEANTIEVTDEVTGEVTKVVVPPEPQRLYYPIDVDENGYGVWAYLCTRGEIKEAIAYDTALQAPTEDGEDPEPVQAKVSVVLTAVSVPTEAVSVENETALKRALEDPNVTAVKLETDMHLDSPVTLKAAEEKLIHLNGYTLSYEDLPAEGESVTHMFELEEGSSLTVLGGTVSCSSTPLGSNGSVGNAAFGSTGGELVLSGVTVTGFDTAVNIKDMEATDSTEDGSEEDAEEDITPVLDSSVKIINSRIDAAQNGIRLNGNGASSEALTKVIVQDSTITGGYMGICGNGNNDRAGTELLIIGSKIEGFYTALYHPQQQSKAIISAGSEMTGYTGVVMKGGTLTVEDSKIRGTGGYTAAAPARSGFTDTGDGLYVEAVYDWSTTVMLKGENEIISDHAYGLDLFGETGKGTGKILVYAGDYSGAKGSAVWNGIGIFEIYGGTFEGALEAPDDMPIVRYDIEE